MAVAAVNEAGAARRQPDGRRVEAGGVEEAGRAEGGEEGVRGSAPLSKRSNKETSRRKTVNEEVLSFNIRFIFYLSLFSHNFSNLFFLSAHLETCAMLAEKMKLNVDLTKQ